MHESSRALFVERKGENGCRGVPSSVKEETFLISGNYQKKEEQGLYGEVIDVLPFHPSLVPGGENTKAVLPTDSSEVGMGNIFTGHKSQGVTLDRALIDLRQYFCKRQFFVDLPGLQSYRTF
jgi:hypothetical protein